jgi:hypothetical protein
MLPFIDTYAAEKAFNGMLGTSYTRVGDDTVGAQPDPADAACLTKYSDANGIDVPQYGTQRWAALVRICHQIDVVVKGLEAAGPNPTHGSFRDALANRGTFHVGFATNGSFTPTKHDAADQFRVVRYDGTTNRFSPVTEFAPAGR